MDAQDAQTLFREGIIALRDRRDAAQARQLLTRSLKLNPDNELAWLWLSRAVSDPSQQKHCVERALRLNPYNEQALTLRDQLNAFEVAPDSHDWDSRLEAMLPQNDVSRDATSPRTGASHKPSPLSERREIHAILAAADERLEAGDAEAAIEQWVRVLAIQVDHPAAIQNAVRHLFKLGYKEDAAELLDRAIAAGTTSIPIHLTAIDVARARHEQDKSDALREKVVLLPDADEDLINKMLDQLVETAQTKRAAGLLAKALERHPDSQALLLRMADMQENALGHKADALIYYERAARVKSGSEAGRIAEKALSGSIPVVTDRERGSVVLALREALGFGVVYLLMGWQDAGLNLLNLGASRWLGVGLSVVGGYLLVTALSAPQQKPLAAWLGGRVPATPPQPSPQPEPIMLDYEPVAQGAIEEPTHLPIIPVGLRAAFVLVGIIVLIGAFLLVFSVSIQLLRNPVAPYVPPIETLLTE